MSKSKSKSRRKAHGWKGPNGRVYPVVESGVGTRVIVTKRDVNRGVRGSQTACAIAQSCMRAYHAPAAFISRTVAYIVEKVPGKGEVAMKYSVTDPTREAIRRFDDGKGMPEGGFVFGRICESWKSGRREERQRVLDARRKRGIQLQPRKRNVVNKRPVIRNLSTFRDGRGLVHTVALKGSGRTR